MSSHPDQWGSGARPPAPSPDQAAAGTPTATFAPAGGGTVSFAGPLAPVPVPASSAGPATTVPEKIGRFQIEQYLGEGAFGRVYRAYDPSLKRQVALKVAKPEQMHSPERIERFQREAQAAAPLTHNHIVAVYDHGQDGPHHYLATAFVPGQSLESVLRELPEGQTLPLTQAVQIVRKLAEALAYAHRQKVTHRDVKPANVMLRQDGEPLLMDFGLANRAEGEHKLTQAGVVMGTPEFMAPEQWQGQAQAASDQYSLGCLLFELLTGRLPFSGGTPGHYLFLHTHQPAPSPRKFNPRLPRDLETICLKCLEKEPNRRYADCQALADDLRRFLDGEPIQARRLGLGERLVRWVRKEPRLALTGAVAAGLLITTVVVLAVSAQTQRRLTEKVQRENKEKQKALDDLQVANEDLRVEQGKTEVQKGKAEKALADYKVEAQRREAEAAAKEQQYRTSLYTTSYHQAWQAYERHDILETRKCLGGLPGDLRGWEWDYLERQCQRKCMNLQGHIAPVNSVSYSPDGKRIVSASSDKTVKVWDARTGQELFTLKGHTESVNSVTCSPDGKRIVSGSGDQTVKAWDAHPPPALPDMKGP